MKRVLDTMQVHFIMIKQIFFYEGDQMNGVHPKILEIIDKLVKVLRIFKDFYPFFLLIQN